MKKLLVFLFGVINLPCHSQIIFEKGYYIDDSDQKIECFIKNIDWENNPADFEYKLSENGDSRRETIKSVKEFGIYNFSKYIRCTVNIDRSSERLSDLSAEKKPVFNQEQLFLKVLIEGKGSLYLFEDRGLVRFFYKVENADVEQLIFKSYKTVDNSVGRNNAFRGQLWNALKCSTILMANIENIKYNERDLTKLFVQYNECDKSDKSDFTNYQEKPNRDLFNLNIRLGVNRSSLAVRNGMSSSMDASFDNELSPRIGIEAEFILPVNKNKWALFIEPTYQPFKSEEKTRTQNVTVDYKSIEISAGFRYYMFLNEKSKVFVNGSVIWFFDVNSKIDFEKTIDLEMGNRNKLAFGAGYKYNDKYSVEVRYGVSQEILSQYLYWSSDFKTLSVIFGYTIF